MIRLHNAFISYGRTDSKNFAKKLHDNLTQQGSKVWFDFNDIPLGVDYQNQIDEGIEKADNFLFIIAPHSVNSPYCGKEVELALKLNKRIIPLLHVEQIEREIWQQRFPNQGDQEWQEYTAKGKHSSFPNMHPEIAKINWVYCREGIDDFEQAFEGLQTILTRQQTYVRQHTLFLSSALEWERQQKQSRYLLVGEERNQAEAWLKVQFKEEQPPCIPTDLHCEFITESTKNSQNLMTQVFLSYAETDFAIMEQVRRSLRREGFTVWTNKTDVQTGVDFQAAIKSGVEEADNIVYLLSPAAVKSHYCQQEIDYAISLNKRIIPLLIQPTDLEQVSPVLRGLQYIDFTNHTADYQQYESKLLRTLRQEATYYEEYKILLTKALKWERQHQNPSILLRGYNLQHAEAWLNVAQSRSHHQPLAIQTEFIAASRKLPPGISLDVFVSYSRADSEFARRLNDALQLQGKTTWFDQESIASGADFQREIYRGIENSNNFIFVISPNSISSPYCKDEVEYAQKLNKRIVTVLHRPVNVPDLHPVLAAVQWIDFAQPQKDFISNFKEVLRTISTDPVHLQSHTRLLVRAIEWDSKGRKESLLLRGDDLEDAEEWIAQAGNRDPKPTSLQQDYVNSSRSVEAANRQASQILEAAAKKGQQRVLVGSTVMAIGLMVAGIATAYAYKAESERKVANTKVQAATKQEKDAKQQAQAAKQQEQAATKQEQLATQQGQAAAKQAQLATQQGQAAAKQAQLAKQQAQAATKQEQLAKQQAQAANQQMTIATAQVSKAEEREKQAQVGLNQAKITTKAAQQKREAAEQELKSATVKTDAAEQKLQKADQNVVLAQQKLSAAEIVQKEAQAGTSLERQAANAMKQFEFDQLNALVAAVKAGKDLKELVKDGRSLDKYPSINPLLALQTILDKIYKKVPIQNTEKRGSTSSFGNETTSTSFSPDGQLQDTEKRGRTSSFGNETYVTSTSFSPDGQRILTTTKNKIAHLWNLQGQELAKFEGDQGDTEDKEISNASFSPDGKRIVTTSKEEGIARIWDVSGRLIAQLKPDQKIVSMASFSPDGQRIVTAAKDGTAQIWESSGSFITELKKDKQDPINPNKFSKFSPTARFSPNGQRIVTSSDQGTQIWNLSGNLIAELPGQSLEFGFSPDGQRFITVSENIAQVWDFSGKPIVTLKGHSKKINYVSFSPDSQLIATASDDGSVRLWNKAGELMAEMKPQVLPARMAQFDPTGKRLLTTADDRVLRIWDISSDPRAPREIAYFGGLSKVLYKPPRLSPDGKHLLVLADGWNSNTVWLWEISDKHPAPKFTVGSNSIFSPDGQRILFNTSERSSGILEIRDLSGNLITEIKGNSDDFNEIWFSDDSQHILGLRKKKTTWNDNNYDFSIMSLPKEQQIINQWDLSGKLVATYPNPEAKERSTKTKVSPDGQHELIIADKTVIIKDKTADQKKADKSIVQLKGHQDTINSANFSRDGQRIVTTSSDRTLRIWDLSGRLMAEMRGQNGFHNAIFSADGQRIIFVENDFVENDFVENDGTVREWQVDNLNQLLTRGCSWLSDYLKNGFDLSEEDRRICDDIPVAAKKTQ